MCGNDCKARIPGLRKANTGVLSGFLLLLVPKCPFCFMAFSGVMVFCGENGTGHSSRIFYSAPTLILTGIFCITALLSILLYYRPARGKYALMLAIPGIIAIILSVTAGGGTLLYYSGALLVMTGLLRNSGLWYYRAKMIFSKNPAHG